LQVWGRRVKKENGRLRKGRNGNRKRDGLIKERLRDDKRGVHAKNVVTVTKQPKREEETLMKRCESEERTAKANIGENRG